MRHHFLAVLSRESVAAAMAGNYIEVSRGRATQLARVAAGDLVVFYSPRATAAPGPALQQFTAIAQARAGENFDGEPVEPDGERPARRRACFLAAAPASIRPLIATLDFIRDKDHWGVALRTGFVQISAGDMSRVAQAMVCDLTDAAPLAA